MTESMGVDIPIALLRDIAVRLGIYEASLTDKYGRKKHKSKKVAENVRASNRLSVADLVHLSPDKLCQMSKRVVRITRAEEFMALTPIITALMQADGVTHRKVVEAFCPEYAVPSVFSLTVQFYPFDDPDG